MSDQILDQGGEFEAMTNSKHGVKAKFLLAAMALAWLASAGAQNRESTRADPSTTQPSAGAEEFRNLDHEVQALKKEVIDLNKDLFALEEELLFPANTQIAVFVSLDVGEFFALDSITLKLDDKEVANYLYTERETQALNRGGVQRLYLGNLKVGSHELVAFFTGKGPHERSYKRGTTLTFDKSIGAKYLELQISDRQSKLQPEFLVKEWE